MENKVITHSNIDALHGEVDNDSSNVIYEFTKDPLFLSQYYKIREICYREDLGLENFSGAEDDYDRIGQVVVAHINGVVIGGSRLIISTPVDRIILPLEEKEFSIINNFPHLNKFAYCEFSRLAILPEFRKKERIEKIVNHLILKANDYGCTYAFAIAPMIQARSYRLIFKRLQFPYKILENIFLPHKPIYDHLNNIGICLSIGGLQHDLLLDHIFAVNQLHEVIA